MWSFRRRGTRSTVRPELFDKLRAGYVEGRTGLRTLIDVPKRLRFDKLSTNGSVLLVALLASCGFHLRGEAHYTFDTLFLNSPAAQPLTTDLKRSLEGIGTAHLVASPETAQVILDIASVENNKQILSLSGGGKVREFLLTKRILFRVHDAAGNDWLPTSEVLVRRSYTYNDTEALAKEAQEQRLWREMQDDAVQQIVRRLQSAKKPA
jgi:LPS-assembly lipoprotein